MRKMRIALISMTACCAATISFAENVAQSHTVNSSRVLDVSSLLKDGLMFAIKEPDTGVVGYTGDGHFLKKGNYFYQGKYRLQGYPVPTELTANDCKLSDVTAPDDAKPPKATTHVVVNGLNLNSAAIPPTQVFNPLNVASWNFNVVGGLHDNAGVAHSLSMYFIKQTDAANQWSVPVYVDGNAIGMGFLTFAADGHLATAAGFSQLRFAVSGTTQQFDISMSGTTQYDGSSGLAGALIVDGTQGGDAIEEVVDHNGYITENYTDGSSTLFSKIAVFAR